MKYLILMFFALLMSSAFAAQPSPSPSPAKPHVCTWFAAHQNIPPRLKQQLAKICQ